MRVVGRDGQVVRRSEHERPAGPFLDDDAPVGLAGAERPVGPAAGTVCGGPSGRDRPVVRRVIDDALILPAVSLSRILPPQGGEYLHEVTAGSISGARPLQVGEVGTLFLHEYGYSIVRFILSACHRNIHRELISPRSRLKRVISKRAYRSFGFG